MLPIGYMLIMIVSILLCQSCKKEKQILNNTNPTVGIINYSDCKQKNGSYTDSVSPAQSCINYLLSNDTLFITHVNTAFNCCFDTILIEFSTSADTLEIGEVESLDVPCDCNCLFDLNIFIAEVSPGDYFFRFVEPYIGGSDEKLEFEVNLQENVPGTFCVTRNNYPWGIF